MERFAVELGARSALLRENDYTAGHVGLFETVGYDATFVAAYRDHFVHLDYFAPVLAKMPVGAFITGDRAVPWEVQRRSEFYNDYVLPQKQRHVMGGILAQSNRYRLMFALQRELGQPDYTEDDLQLVRLIAPHMAKAVQINRQMTDVSTQKHWALSALDRLRVGVILLDERGRPLFLNREAERLATTGNDFVAGREGLALPSATETACLQRMIADAAKVASGKAGTAGNLHIHLASTSAAKLQFNVIPLPRDLSERAWEQSQCNGCVAVFISASGGPHLSWERMKRMYGFTQAEAKLAAQLAKGASLEAAAEANSVSIGTVRSHLKSIFTKTGVSRQAELVAHLLADMLCDHEDRSIQSR